jgi:hypothetical protein
LLPILVDDPDGIGRDIIQFPGCDIIFHGWDFAGQIGMVDFFLFPLRLIVGNFFHFSQENNHSHNGGSFWWGY